MLWRLLECNEIAERSESLQLRIVKFHPKTLRPTKFNLASVTAALQLAVVWSRRNVWVGIGKRSPPSSRAESARRCGWISIAFRAFEFFLRGEAATK